MRTNLLIFIFSLILVVLFHYLLDSSYLNFGMHSDDWISLVRYKALEGNFHLDSFSSYLFFLISRVTIVFGLINVFLAVILLKKRRRFIFLAIVLNLFFEILVFLLATRKSFDFNILYSVFVGLFVFVLSISCIIEWLATGKKNGLLLALWAGPLASLYFIFCNWLFADSFLAFAPSQEYLTVPAIGVSLMFAALLTSFYDKIKDIRIFHSGKSMAVCILILIFFPIYGVNKTRTTDWLTSIIKQNNALQQQDIQQKIRGQIKESAEDKLVFFD